MRLNRSLAPLTLACLALMGCGSTGPKVSDTELWVIRLEQFGSTDRRLGTIYLFLRLNETTQSTDSAGCYGSAPQPSTTFVATVSAPEMRLQPTATGSANGSWGGCYDLFSASVMITGGPTYNLTGSSGQGAPPYDDTNVQLLGDGQCFTGKYRYRQWSSGDRVGCWTMYRAKTASTGNFDTEPHDDAYIDIDMTDQTGNDWTVTHPSSPDSLLFGVPSNGTVHVQDLRYDNTSDEFFAHSGNIVTGFNDVDGKCALTPSTPNHVGLVLAGTDGKNPNAFQCVNGWSRAP